MNKMAGLSAAVALIFFLTACGGSKNGNLEVSEVNKDGSFKMEATDASGGNVTVEGGQSELPKDFPKDIPIMDGAKIQSSLKTTSDQGDGYIVNFTVDKSVEACAKYYHDFLDQSGYQTSELTTDGNVTLMGGNDLKSFFIGIMPDESNTGQTMVTITYGDNGS